MQKDTVSRYRQLLYTTYGFGTTGCQISPIFAFFAYFSHTKRLKYLFLRGLQLRGYTAECIRLFPVVVEGPNGCVVLVGFFMRRMVGELGPPNLPKLRLWKMAINGTYTVRIRSGPNTYIRARMCLLEV